MAEKRKRECEGGRGGLLGTWMAIDMVVEMEFKRKYGESHW